MADLQPDFFVQMHTDFEKLKDFYNWKKHKENWKVKINEGINLADYMIRQLDKIIQCSCRENSKYFRLIGMRTSLILENSKALKTINEVEMAETILDDAYKDIKPIMDEPELGYVMICIISHLTYYLYSRNLIDKAGTILEDLEIFYYNVIHKTDTNTVWYTSKDLFMPTADIVSQDITKQYIESIFINGMKLLRCVYYKQENHEKYALYEHYILARELNMPGTDILEWSNASIRLALFLMAHYKFKDARHHLAAAFYVLNDYMNRISMCAVTELVFKRVLEIQKVFANIARGWGKYGIFLFNVSKNYDFKKKYGDMTNALNSLWQYPLTEIDLNNNNQNIYCSFSDRNFNISSSKQIPQANDEDIVNECKKAIEDIRNLLGNTQNNVKEIGDSEEANDKTNTLDQKTHSCENKEQLYGDEVNQKHAGLELASGEDLKQSSGQSDQKITDTLKDKDINSSANNTEECGSGDIITTVKIEKTTTSNTNISQNNNLNDEKN